MKVILISWTPEPLKVVYVAARISHSFDIPSQIWQKQVPLEEMECLIEKLYNLGHHSVFEHISFTFLIEGISRVCSHQLVRHRIASFTQQSQRYVRLKDNKDIFVFPESFLKDEKIKRKVDDFYKKSMDLYNFLLSEKIRKEDARFIIPQGVKTNLIMTMNFRELMHACSLRLSKHAQWEIRQLFTKIKEEIERKVSPFLAKFLKPEENE